jgi:hypothetical protein
VATPEPGLTREAGGRENPPLPLGIVPGIVLTLPLRHGPEGPVFCDCSHGGKETAHILRGVRHVIGIQPPPNELP